MPLHAALLTLVLAAQAPDAEVPVELRLADGRAAAGVSVVPLGPAPAGSGAGTRFVLDGEGKAHVPFEPRQLFVEGGSGACQAVVPLRDGLGTLPACAERRFRLVDSSGGRPVKGASALCLTEAGWQFLQGRDVGPGSTLGPTAQGVVRSEAGTVFCRFLAPGFGVGAFVRVARIGAGPLDVTMTGGSPLEGLFVDSRDQAVAGRDVQVAVRPASDARTRPGENPWLPIARASSDERGRIELGALPRPVRLFVDDPAFPPAFQVCEGPAPSPCRLTLPDASALEAVFVLDDEPLKGVKLSVVQFDSRAPESVSKREAVSDAAGLAVVRGLSRALDRARVEVEAPGGIVDRRLLADPLEERVSLGVWPLEAAVPTTVSVATAEGKAVSGARISDARWKRLLGVTDERGSVAVPVPARSGRTVRVEAAGHLPASRDLGPGVAARVALSRKGRITLRARTSDGRVVREAVLGAVGFGAVQREVMSTAGDDGELVFDVSPGDTHWLLRAEGAEPLDLGTFSVPAGETHAIGNIELSVGATIDGRLLSRDGGIPLVGARVTAQPVRDDDIFDVLNERLPAAKTGLDGTFRVTGLPSGRTRLFLEAPGYAAHRIDVDASLEGTPIGPVFLDPGRPLEVRLRNASGDPVGEVRLRVRPGGLDGTLREEIYSASGEGVVTIPRISAGAWGFVAEARGTSPRRRVVLDGTETSFEWSLTGTSVTGQLTLGGTPLSEASVFVRTPQAGIRMIQLDRNSLDGLALEPLRLGDAPQIRSGPVDPEGRFRIESVTEDEVVLFAAGPAWASQPIRLALPGRGEVRQDLELGGRKLEVYVVDGDGHPVPGAGVALVGDEATGLSQATADAAGRTTFFLNGTVPIRAVRASDPSRRRGMAPFREMPDLEVTVVLGPPPGPAEVSVLDGDGRPAPQANVCAIGDADGSTSRGRTDLHGVVRFRGLLEGSYRLLAEGAKSEFAAATLRVGAGGGAATVRLGPTGTLLLRLRAGEAEHDAARLRIRVLDADGRDLAAEAAALGRPARFRDDDRYVLPILPAGSYRVQVDDGKKALLDEAVRIRAGEQTERAVR
jgi:hypothetical protein